jgi:hypothetical protein
VQAKVVAGFVEDDREEVILPFAGPEREVRVRIMSPDQVLPSWTKTVVAMALVGSAWPAMRMSPKRESPWTAPGVPRAEPSSLTTPMLMLELTAQVWKARRMVCSQATGAMPSWPVSAADRLLPRLTA